MEQDNKKSNLKQKTAVILPLPEIEYEELLENFHDLAIIEERKDQPTIIFSDLKKKLQADGLI